MKHIALFIPELECGGAQRVFLQLSREFISLGYKVDLVLSQTRGALLTEVAQEVHLIDLSAKSIFGSIGLGLSSIWKLRGYLCSHKPDVLLSTLTGANLAAVIARSLSGTNTHLVLREAVSLKNRPGWQWRWLLKWMYPKTDAIVTLSPFMRQEMVSLIGIPEHKVFCIPNPVDLICLQDLSKEPIDESTYSFRDELFILSVGRLTKQKSHETLIRAFSKLHTNNIHLVILGEGPERHKLESLVSKLGLKNNIHLPGHEINPWRWLKLSQLYVLSSRWEGHPNALLEAIAFGIPVVSTEYDSSVHDLVGTNGRVVSVGDVDGMALAIKEILDYPPVTSNHGIFSVQEIAKLYLNICVIRNSGYHE